MGTLSNDLLAVMTWIIPVLECTVIVKQKKKSEKKKCFNTIVFSYNNTYYAIISKNAICQKCVFKAVCTVTSKVSSPQQGSALQPMGCWEVAASWEEMGSGMLTQE